MTRTPLSRTEEARMLAGELYQPADPLLVAARARARRLTRLYNDTGERDDDRRRELLAELLGAVGERVVIEPPFRCDYGAQIRLGDGVFVNFDCVILDCAPVEIGALTLLGPAVHVYAATHPTDPAVRAEGRELALPVRLGANVWVGGMTVVGPGVTIGDNSVIGAGSVVVRDVPANVVAAGNPARVLRELGEGRAASLGRDGG